MSTLAPPRVEPVPDDRAHISRVPYLPGLDGMRALAVVAVMVYHANSDWLPGGFLGVEMFFVISRLPDHVAADLRARTHLPDLAAPVLAAPRAAPAPGVVHDDVLRHRLDGDLQEPRRSARCAAT